MPPNDSLIFRAFCSQTENSACRCITLLPMLPIFRDRTADTANRTVFANYWRPFNFGIPFFLDYATASSYTQSGQRLLMLQNFFLLTNSSRSKRFAQKLRNYILQSNSLRTIRFSHCSIYVKNLSNFIVDSSPCQFCTVIPIVFGSPACQKSQDLV